MEVNVQAFGKIAEITGGRVWKVEEKNTTDEIRRHFEEAWPAMRDMRYLIAVDKKIITANTPLQNGAEVALLPPFSGG